VAEEPDDPLDRLFHAVEVVEGGVHLNRAVHEDAAKARVLRRIHNLGLTNGGQNSLGSRGVDQRIFLARFKVLEEGHLNFFATLIVLRVAGKQVVGRGHRSLLFQRVSIGPAALDWLHT
jgi:hypothetical protein